MPDGVQACAPTPQTVTRMHPVRQDAGDAARSLAWLHWAVHVAFGQAAGQHLLPVLARGGSATVREMKKNRPPAERLARVLLCVLLTQHISLHPQFCMWCFWLHQTVTCAALFL